MFLRSQIKLAFNALRRSPQFTFTSVLTLALAGGALIFAATLAATFLFSPLPYPDGERLVIVRQDLRGKGFDGDGYATVPAALHWFRNNRLLERASLSMPGQEIISDFKGEPKIPLGYVTAGYFDLFGGRIVLGRTFSPREEIGNKARVVLIGESLWREEYAGSPQVLGKSIRIQDVPYQIIGVVADSFAEPLSFGQRNRMWLPFDAGGHYEATWDQTFGELRLAGRLKPGVTGAQLQTDLAGSIAGLRGEWQSAWPDLESVAPRVAVFRDEEVGDFARNSVALAVTAFALFLIALVNITSLFLSRAVAKKYLIGLQSMLGATRAQLALSSMAESALIGVFSGVAALAVYTVLAYATARAGADTLPLGDLLGPNPTAVALAVAVTVFSCLFLALANIGVLNQSTPLGYNRRTHVSRPLLNSLAFFQLALAAAILVFITTVALKSFAQIARPVNAEIDRAYNVFAFTLAPDLDDEEKYAMGNALLRSLERLPGVERATHGSPPVDATNIATDLVDAAQNNHGFFRAGFIGPGYLEMYGIRILRGRDLGPEAYRGVTKEILVSEDTAERLAKGGDVLGNYVSQSGDDKYQIVGVTENVYDPKHYALDRGARVWWPYRPSPFRLQIMTKPGVALSRAQVQTALREVNEKIFVWEFNPVKETYDAALFRERIVFLSLAVISVVTLLLVLSGILGLVSYQVRLLARDIGIRIAIGANNGDILRLGIRRFGVVIVPALAAALLILWLAGRLLGSTLEGIYEPSWQVTSIVLGIVGLCALAACILPVRRLLALPTRQLLSQ